MSSINCKFNTLLANWALFNRPFLTSLFLTGPVDKNRNNFKPFQPALWTKIFPVVIKFILKIIKFGDENFKIRDNKEYPFIFTTSRFIIR